MGVAACLRVALWGQRLPLEPRPPASWRRGWTQGSPAHSPSTLLHGHPAHPAGPRLFCSVQWQAWSWAEAAQPCNHWPRLFWASRLPPTGSRGLGWDLLPCRLWSGQETRGPTQRLVFPEGCVLPSRGALGWRWPGSAPLHAPRWAPAFSPSPAVTLREALPLSEAPLSHWQSGEADPPTSQGCAWCWASVVPAAPGASLPASSQETEVQVLGPPMTPKTWAGPEGLTPPRALVTGELGPCSGDTGVGRGPEAARGLAGGLNSGLQVHTEGSGGRGMACPPVIYWFIQPPPPDTAPDQRFSTCTAGPAATARLHCQKHRLTGPAPHLQGPEPLGMEPGHLWFSRPHARSSWRTTACGQLADRSVHQIFQVCLFAKDLS